MATSLFAHLALQFGTQPENLATEALGYVLQNSETARAAVRDLLRGLGSTIDDHLAYATQSSGQDRARPDLVGRCSTGAEPLLIEVKFWAGLTENQPVAYLDRLPAGGTLLIVAPATRSEMLWDELRRRCRDAGREFTDGSRGAVKIASTGGRHLISLSWRHLLSAIRVQVEARSERQAAEDIAQLEGLCDRMDEAAFLLLSSEELTSSMSRRVVEFGVIVDDVTIQLASSGLANTKNVRATALNGYYGRYLVLSGVDTFLRCDTRMWAKRASTPLWLSVYGTNWAKSDPLLAQRALAPLEAERLGTVFKGDDGFPAVALFVPTGVERDVILRRVTEQIQNVAALIAPLRGDSPDAAPMQPEMP
jgi:hypothetical protein